MLKQIDEIAARRANFMIETTLAALTYLDKISLWRRAGYHVSLIYLRLPSADHAVERVRRRVAAGGHAIPEATIRRRFTMGLDYLDKYYKQAVDAWYIVDSLEGSYELAERSGD
jgi:predicted ABC-type ATPase